MTNLIDLYTDFFRIDLDAPGGYARVADVVARQEDGTSVHRAFKLMRHELDEKQVGLQRFENELKILVEITKDKKAPPAITRIYDSGFSPVELSVTLHNLHEGEKLSPNLEFVSTGTEIGKFLELKSVLMEREPDRWLPYLVVDLAPYTDSLLRQIKPQSANDFLNLYRLPVSTIIEMVLQLSDVMDYMHKKLRYAYIDWKPEHIYWNESLKQLKLIDWNVTNSLNDSPGERQNIREDIRMLCGAALYCSLALNDPEDPNKPIGPAPKVPQNMVPIIRPRYWTDKPNFYQRDSILDDRIKQLVQIGLDPNQGFISPQELKTALLRYGEESGKEGNKKIDDDNRDLISKLPIEAVQHYRRARSYIAAKDYSYAKLSLEVAIEAAKVAGMIYPDAEQLLISVQDLLEVREFRQKVTLVLELGQWKDAVNLYNKALSLDPTNITMKKELDSLQSLISSEPELRKKGLLKIFMPIRRLQTAVDTAKRVMNPRNPRLVSVQKQIHQITQIRIGGIIILLLLGFVGFSSLSGKFEVFAPPSAAPALTSTPTIVLTDTPTQLVEQIKTSTHTDIPSPTPTNSSTPTPTLVILDYGKLESYYFRPYDEPNKNILTNVVIKRNQFLMILAKKESSGALWYECTWEIGGVVGKGWILADRIKIVEATPTPTPTSFILEVTFGELISTSFKPYDEPDKTPLDITLVKNQPLKILRGKESSSALWYECIWEVGGVTGHGWILADQIKIVQPPTATITPATAP